ncbi:MAG TPA: protein phosphatase 2C domain-containing protein [Gemmatimonadaceae bacterium]|nr:protein phosphatase 2C domain-containing protein [Gemmatimonadaceae bacterium]
MTADSATDIGPTRKPLDTEIDIYGLTHTGLVRKENQDHFLISSLRREVFVHQSSLPPGEVKSSNERMALLAVVADGVGSSAMGGEASRQAVEGILNYVSACSKCFYRLDSGDVADLNDPLSDAVMRVHADIAREREEGPPDARGMATTMTLWLGVWPYAYLLQVGDSRCYVMRGGQLQQISRDQTLVQDLVDAGALTQTQALRSPLSHVLSSAIGGQEAAPVITRFEQQWDQIGLLCSDGLTKHVSDEQIAERLRTMTSARQACEALLQDALDAGGTDNITIVIGRPTPAKVSHPLLHATVR